MPRADRWLGTALVVLALAWLWLVQTQIPAPASQGPGPRGFPLLLGVVLAVLGASIAVSAKVSRATRDEPASSSDEPARPAREVSMAVGTLGVLLLYAYLLERAGFLLATPVVIALAMAGLLRLRRWVPVLSLAVGFTLGCWAVFEALGTPLPRGSWVGW